jgi:uncharacterized protein YjiS (DUF1127 family)
MLLIALKYLIERKLAGRRAYAQIRRELDSTSDRDLADMGLSRGDAEPIARQAGRDAEEKARAQIELKKKKSKALADIGAPPQVYY